MKRRRIALVAAVAAFAVLAGCGRGDSSDEAAPAPVAQLPAEIVPADLAGLRVKQEDMAKTLEKVRRSYVEQSGLYALRSPDERLQATLQVSRLRDDPHHRSAAFRSTIVAQVGSSAPRATRMGETTVWRTTGTRQSVAVWFHDTYFFVLAVREDYPRPRSLIRAALEVKP